MDDGRKVQVKVGEFGLYGTAAHISVGFHDDEGINLLDVNGLPHSPNSWKEIVVTLGILGRGLEIVKYGPDVSGTSKYP